MPPLPSSPATLTSTRTSVSASPWRPSCSSAESVATEWIRRQSGSSCLTLRLCRLPMKSHSKASPQRSCLAARSCWRFSPTSVDAGLGEGAHLLQRHVLGRGEDLDPGRRRARAPARGWRRSSPGRGRGSGPALRPPSLEPDQPAWRPVRPPSRRWEKKSSSSQLVQRPADLDALDPGLAQQSPGDLGQVEHPARGDARRRGRRRRRAPRRRPRSSRGRSRGRSRLRWRRPPRRRGRRSRPPGRASRSGASPRRRARRAATGRQSATKTSGARPGPACASTSAVGLRGSATSSALRPVVEGQLGAVHLAADRDPLGRSRVPREAARFSSTLVGVLGETPRLRLSKGGSLTPPSGSRRRPVAPGRSASSQRTPSALAPLHASPPAAASATASSCSRPAISPSSLRRRAASRPRPTAGPCGDAGGDQVLAVDLERDIAPLAQVAVEPLGAQRPGEDQLDRVAAARPAPPPPRAARGRPRPAPPRRPRPERRGKQRRGRGATLRPGRPREQLGDPGGQLDPALARLDQAPLGEQGQARAARRSRRRAAAARPRGDRPRPCPGRPRAAAPRSRARARSRSGRRSGRRAAPGSGRPRRSAGAGRAAARPRGRPAAVGVDQPRLALQRDRHRVDREVAAGEVGLDARPPARPPGSAPGCG